MATEYNFDHTRETDTNITEQDCLGILSRKHFFKILVENVSMAKAKLLIANTAKGVEEALNTTETLMNSYSKATYVEGTIAEHIHGPSASFGKSACTI